MNHPTHNWHSDTQQRMTLRTVAELMYIRQDAASAAKAAETMGNEQQAGQYWDEHHYAAMELKRRQS
jgi:hypothetical protein